MLDIFKNILSLLASSQAGKSDENRIGRLEKELSRKFDALRSESKHESRKRWVIFVSMLMLLGLAAFLGYRQMRDQVGQMVTQRLDKEFSSVNVQKNIEESAKKYAEQNLKQYIEGEISTQYRVFKLEAMARQDSRKAYEDLWVLSQDAKHKEAAEFSLSVIQQQFSSLVYPFEPQGALENTEGSTIQLKLDPSKGALAAMEALKPRLRQLAQQSEKDYLVPDFIRFLKESDSLGASVGVCRILIHNYGNQAGDYEFGKWVQYLEGLEKDNIKISTRA